MGTLRLFASLLTSDAARMIVTFRHGEGQLGEIAGAVRFDHQNNIHHRTFWMLELKMGARGGGGSRPRSRC